jgi:hypothetical protein
MCLALSAYSEKRFRVVGMICVQAQIRLLGSRITSETIPPPKRKALFSYFYL